MKRFRKRSDILERDEHGVMVLYDPATGIPYSLEGSAREIWKLLERGMTVEEVLEKLEERFEKDPSMRRDIEEFLADCVKEGLADVF